MEDPEETEITFGHIFNYICFTFKSPTGIALGTFKMGSVTKHTCQETGTTLSTIPSSYKTHGKLPDTQVLDSRGVPSNCL